MSEKEKGFFGMLIVLAWMLAWLMPSPFQVPGQAQQCDCSDINSAQRSEMRREAARSGEILSEIVVKSALTEHLAYLHPRTTGRAE